MTASLSRRVEGLLERLRLLEAVAEAARAYREAEKDDDEAVASIVTALDFETEKQFAAAQAVTRAAADTAYDALTDAFAALDAHEREPAE
ncbi:MAG TPA: hypothetical protein VN085_11525 [Vicinamibacterales bacterium]|nr:hypothetical protein [Vicinamibacterales bacterium]